MAFLSDKGVIALVELTRGEAGGSIRGSLYFSGFLLSRIFRKYRMPRRGIAERSLLVDSA
jgi:hypothetical protein